MKETKGSNVKIVEEISRRRIELIVYAAFFAGFLAAAQEQRTADSLENFTEIKNLIDLMSKDNL